MEVLRALLYGEYGILHRVETGDEDRVVQFEKKWVMELVDESRQKYEAGELTNDELFIYIDVLDVFSPFQHVEWICEMSKQIHNILIKDNNLFIDNQKRDELSDLIHVQRELIHKIEQGNEHIIDDVDKAKVIELAKETNQKYHARTLSNEELLIFIDFLYHLMPYRALNQVWELQADIVEKILLKI